jgi:putative transposase
MERIPYPSDLTDEQWNLIEPLIPRAKPGGRPRSVEMRPVINGILYINRGGCSWRMLPRDFPPWGTVHYYYRQFRLAGIWQTIHDSLRPLVRRQAGKKPTPSAAILDSQSIKTAEKGGSAGMMRARKSRVESGTFSSIRWE